MSHRQALYSFSGAAVTECHRLGGLHNRHVLSHSSGSQKPEAASEHCEGVCPMPLHWVWGFAAGFGIPGCGWHSPYVFNQLPFVRVPLHMAYTWVLKVTLFKYSVQWH